MSDLAEHQRASGRTLYIVWMVLLISGFTILQVGVVAGVYVLNLGIPTLAQFTTMKVPVYSQATLWNGRVAYPIQIVGGDSVDPDGNLVTFDPESGDSQQHHVTVPIPKTGMVGVGDTLWCVSPTTVTRVQDDLSTEIAPKHSLKSPCPPFVYEQRPAVLDWIASNSVMLRTFDGVDWIDEQWVEIPTLLSRTVDGSNLLIANSVNEAAAAPQSGRFSPLEIRVIAEGGLFHLFVSDGVNFAYRSGIEFAQSASALVPENVSNLTSLKGWEGVCQMPRSATAKQNSWAVGMVAGEPILLTATTVAAPPFGNSTVAVFARNEGKWAEASHLSTPALVSLLAFTNGEQTYVAGQPLVPTLRFYKMVNNELQATGTFLKSPTTKSQVGSEFLSRSLQWVYWPVLVVFAMAVSKLMAVYTTPAYQFGAHTVELASYTRRMVARLIDHAFFVISSYFLVQAFGFGTRERVEENMDRMFDLGPDSLLVRYVLLMSSMLALAVFLLILNSGLQAQWGVTLGKWICGIRTKRATLRPCGFFRAMLRELLLVVDTIFGMTAIPATLAIALTSSRQRLGDLVADTIVIRQRRTAPTGKVASENAEATSD